MDYELRVTGVLGVEHAEVWMRSGQVTEVVGPNASGKTSIATAAQAVLALDINPLGLPATDAKRHYAHDGDLDATTATLGVYRVEGADADDPVHVLEGEVVWRPAAQTVTAPPDLRPSRPEAVGLTDFRARKSAKERAEALQSALLPPPDEVLAAVEEALKPYLGGKDLAGVMEMLRERGWNKTEAVYVDRGKVAKRQWGDIAGRQWGVRVAADWRPDRWSADWDGLTVADAQAQVTDARDALATLHRAQAVTEAEAEAAAAAASQLPALADDEKAAADRLADATGAADTARAEAARASSEATDANRALQSARQAVEASEMTATRHAGTEGSPCPHCEGLLLISDGRVLVFDAEVHETNLAQMTAETERLRGVRAEVQEQWDDAENRRGAAAEAAAKAETVEREARTAHGTARAALAAAQASAERADLAVRTEQDAIALAQAEQSVEDAKEVVDAVTAQQHAAELHKTIVRYTAVARLLGPEGVRAKMLESGLARLNTGLESLASLTGWAQVAVAGNGSVTWADRPVPMCSESEQWRAQACIQLTLAAITGAGVVVLDRADLLDSENRPYLVEMLGRVARSTGVAVLVCSTGDRDPSAAWPQVRVAAGRTEETS